MSVNEEPESQGKSLLWGFGAFVLIVLLGMLGLSSYWSIEPKPFNAVEETLKATKLTDPELLPDGAVYANSLAQIADALLHKPGGYLTNDVAPPSIFMDNMPSWEHGALVMLRDATSGLRNHFSRAQSQSPEDPDLAKAEPYFYYERDSWALPSTEAEYQKGIDALHRYIARLNDPAAKKPGHFYSRADNLWVYMEVVIKRLGDLSTRLNAQSERYERQFEKNPSKKKAAVGRTSWMDIDDIFWEARGGSWALLHILKAIKYDFRLILEDKRAMKTVDIMIHEMENALTPVLSPMILNGDGYGLFANYSLAMANYIARANAAALDLRDVMNRG